MAMMSFGHHTTRRRRRRRRRARTEPSLHRPRGRASFHPRAGGFRGPARGRRTTTRRGTNERSIDRSIARERRGRKREGARDERDARGRGRAAFWCVPWGTLGIIRVMTHDRSVHRSLVSHHSYMRAPRRRARNETKRISRRDDDARARDSTTGRGRRGGGRGRTTRVATRNGDEHRRRSRRNGRPGRTETPRREAARRREGQREGTRARAVIPARGATDRVGVGVSLSSDFSTTSAFARTRTGSIYSCRARASSSTTSTSTIVGGGDEWRRVRQNLETTHPSSSPG